MKQISGAAISESEAKRLAEQIPNTKMNESTFMAAVDTYNDEQRKKVIELDEIIKMDKYRLLTFFEEREYDSYAKIDRRKI